MVELRMAETKPIPLLAYAMKRDGRNVRWVEIGVGALHEDGKGFSAFLDRLPVGGFNGRILFRPPEETPAEPGATPTRPGADEES